MNDTMMSRQQSRPHYAKVIAMAGAAWVAISLFLPVVRGPFGMQASGWQLLSDHVAMAVPALMIAIIVGMLGMYLVCALIGGVLGTMLVSKIHGVMTALDGGTPGDGSEPLTDAMGAMLSTQLGIAWGAPLVMLGILAMLTCRAFYHR